MFGKDVFVVSPQRNEPLGTPSGLAIDVENHRLYVSDRLNGNIEKLSYSGSRELLLVRERVDRIRSLEFYGDALYVTQLGATNVNEGQLLRVGLRSANPVLEQVRSTLHDPQDVRVVFAAAQAPSKNGRRYAWCRDVHSHTSTWMMNFTMLTGLCRCLLLSYVKLRRCTAF